MGKHTHRQVLLRRPSSNGGWYEDVFWIDITFAKRGKKVIDDLGMIWIVCETYDSADRATLDQRRSVDSRFREILDG